MTDRRLALLGAILYTVYLLVLVSLAFAVIQTYRGRHRGITYGPPPDIPLAVGRSLGINASLEQYDDQELADALTKISDAGFRWVRQRFPWDQIEPLPGDYAWQRWDRIVDAVEENGLSLIAVLEASPAWARSGSDDSRTPPDDLTSYARFATTLATHYRGHIAAYQIWDQPNIWPNWGPRDTDPAGYVALLRAGYQAIKEADPAAVVLSAALAPNTERGGRNMNELSFLAGMYQAGAQAYFDALAARPYGFWFDPEDRRVAPEIPNFSRLILLRDVMVGYGDAHKAIWAVEMGWNALPEGWTGAPSPWGADAETVQADRLKRAIRRARQEWPWLGVMAIQHFQPAAALDDPVWGFSLVTPDGQPRLAYETIRAAPDLSDPGPFVARRAPFGRAYASLALIGVAAVVVSWRLAQLLRSPAWRALCRTLAEGHRALAEWQQIGLMVATVTAFYFAPTPVLSLVLIIPTTALIALRLDLGLSAVVFAAPFFFHPKSFGPKVFSLVEVLTVICAAVWALRSDCGARWLLVDRGSRIRSRLTLLLRRLSGLDWAILFFVVTGVLSIGVSELKAVSLRELRVVVLGPALFYLMVRSLRLRRRGILLLTDALVAAGAVVALYGLYTYFLTDLVITAEGVRRMRSVYPSPNNLALYLGRVIPLAGAMALFGEPGRRRSTYGLASAAMLAAAFLTLSRGAWLVGLPATALFIGLMRGRRTAVIAAAVMAAGLLSVLPLARLERIASLLDFRTGTTFLRLKLWEATLAMIRDHPLFGVGLDNFLYQYRSRYILPEAWQEPDLSHPHNVILDFWTRLGIPGVLALLWAQVLFFRLGRRVYRRLANPEVRALALGLMASMVYVLAHGLVDQTYFVVDLAYVFMLLLGLIQGIGDVAE